MPGDVCSLTASSSPPSGVGDEQRSGTVHAGADGRRWFWLLPVDAADLSLAIPYRLTVRHDFNTFSISKTQVSLVARSRI
jgi:hypothetical protein